VCTNVDDERPLGGGERVLRRRLADVRLGKDRAADWHSRRLLLSRRWNRRRLGRLHAELSDAVRADVGVLLEVERRVVPAPSLLLLAAALAKERQGVGKRQPLLARAGRRRRRERRTLSLRAALLEVASGGPEKERGSVARQVDLEIVLQACRLKSALCVRCNPTRGRAHRHNGNPGAVDDELLAGSSSLRIDRRTAAADAE